MYLCTGDASALAPTTAMAGLGEVKVPVSGGGYNNSGDAQKLNDSIRTK